MSNDVSNSLSLTNTSVNHRKVEAAKPDPIIDVPTHVTHVNSSPKVSRFVKLNPYNLLHRAVTGSLFTLTHSVSKSDAKNSFLSPLREVAPTFVRLTSHADTPNWSFDSKTRGGGKLKYSPPPESVPPKRQCLTTPASKPASPSLTRASPSASSISSIDKTRRHGRVCCVIRTPQRSAFSSQRDSAKSYRPSTFVSRTTMKLRERIVLGKFLFPSPSHPDLDSSKVAKLVETISLL